MPNDWETKIDELLADESDRLSGREVEFIEDLDRLRELDGWEPTDGQEAWLDRIWGRVFG